MVVFGQNGFIRAKVVVFRQKWLYSGKMVLFGQAKVVVFRQKWLCSGTSGSIRAK